MKQQNHNYFHLYNQPKSDRIRNIKKCILNKEVAESNYFKVYTQLKSENTYSVILT